MILLLEQNKFKVQYLCKCMYLILQSISTSTIISYNLFFHFIIDQKNSTYYFLLKFPKNIKYVHRSCSK